MKKTGFTFDKLTTKYASKIFGTNFSNLSPSQKNLVYLEIIDSSGRPSPPVTLAAKRYTTLGRGLIIVTIGFAVYNIASAEDKITATAREGLVIGGGFSGGAGGGALAGLACGPGSPVCVTVGVFIGGALGALGVEITFGWFFNEY